MQTTVRQTPFNFTLVGEAIVEVTQTGDKVEKVDVILKDGTRLEDVTNNRTERRKLFRDNDFDREWLMFDSAVRGNHRSVSRTTNVAKMGHGTGVIIDTLYARYEDESLTIISKMGGMVHEDNTPYSYEEIIEHVDNGTHYGHRDYYIFALADNCTTETYDWNEKIEEILVDSRPFGDNEDATLDELSTHTDLISAVHILTELLKLHININNLHEILKTLETQHVIPYMLSNR